MPEQKGFSCHVCLWIPEQREKRRDCIQVGRILVQRMFVRKLRELRIRVPDPIKIGTRGSKLALWQAEWVRSALQAVHPGLTIEIVTIKTTGDKILDVPLSRVGGKGLFVKEIEESLLQSHIDLAVHSMKDMPAQLPEGLKIGAVPERENPQDVLISRFGKPLAELTPGSRIGTSSLRRSVQLKHRRPDFEILPLRGNIDTRIRKLETENLDAIVLAAAGVRRMNLENHISEYLDLSVMLPAVGQGALCIQIRKDDPVIAVLVEGLNHPVTRVGVEAERAFLSRMEGSCQVPIAAAGNVSGDTVSLCGLIADLDGKRLIQDNLSGPKEAPERVGYGLADRLLEAGGKEILKTVLAQIKDGEKR